MPAAAVIPAPIGYIKVVAVEKLVVVFLMGRCLLLVLAKAERLGAACHFVGSSGQVVVHSMTWSLHSVTESKLECSKQALQL